MAVFNRVRSICMQRCKTHSNSWKVWKQLNYLKRHCNYADINSISCSDFLRTPTKHRGKKLTIFSRVGKMIAGSISLLFTACLSKCKIGEKRF